MSQIKPIFLTVTASAVLLFAGEGVLRSPTVKAEPPAATKTSGRNSLSQLGETQWKFQTDGRIHTSPLPVGDTVFVVSHQRGFYRKDFQGVHQGLDYGTVYAIDFKTGKELWRFKPEERSSFQTEGWSSGAPAVANDVLGYTSFGERLYGVSASTGEPKWSFKADNIFSASPVLAGETFYLGNWDGNFYAIDANAGKEKWRFQTKNRTLGQAAVENGIVYTGNMNGRIYALDAKTGPSQETVPYKWSCNTGSPVTSSVAVSNGVVYFGTEDGRFFAVKQDQERPVVGVEKWVFNTSTRYSTFSITSIPVVTEKGVYFGNSNGALYKLNKDNGTLAWNFFTKDRETLDAAPCLIGDKVFVATQGGNLYELDDRTGKLLRSFRVGSPVFSTPLKQDNRLFIATERELLGFTLSGQ